MDQHSTFIRSIKGIRFRYIFPWFRDQLTQSGWFRNLIVSRKAWGAFSIYSHERRSDGKVKIVYTTKEKAIIAADEMGKKYDAHFVAYKCLFCKGWHISKTDQIVKNHEAIRIPDPDYHISNEMDMEKILATGIPDLAPVYGGLRGRTLSSVKQFHAWKPLVEAGIRQVIDLRADYTSNAYNERCKEFGIEYFHYPVVRGGILESRMVELFPELCALIDKGHFYIACAHGLHRTDIALCLYWVFYGADRGKLPPPICGYRQDKGLDTHKIMRALNSMYSEFAKRDGKEPIPQSVFIERKKVINELSKI